jgi:hypothetical protein
MRGAWLFIAAHWPPAILRRLPKCPRSTVGPMNTSTPNSVSTDLLSEHATVTPSILYFGTPVVLLSTENENGTFNLAPMSSAWALGHAIVGLPP